MVYAGSPIGGGRLGTRLSLLEIAGAEGTALNGCGRLFGLGTAACRRTRPYDLVRSVAIASAEL